MNRPDFTEQQLKDYKEIYDKFLMDGFLMVSYIGEKPQCVKDQDVKWERMVKEKFGEDSEITRYILTPKLGFITGK